ncbi:uncharacterized protein MONBRDRAFT_14626 [Monosiga brevicollis MX1]|uniref:Helicase ATP-binding domain-containing protein n=1 Tax=Monosiga brevicollis TaxID=81824 RepID=A9URD6_MONBE|nr:uncharacterized protein MONBRDRAFT_14626 [Monosiga brevicollis MX1]EDQ91904.1 predicted protein [Monosiga brevicollis MX1]|eukprot:XP_001743190.1 hypothetical protein [Monosiga brevicollis MX1]
MHVAFLALLPPGTYEGQRSLIDVIARAGPGNVLITTYSQLRVQQSKLQRHNWHYFIMDEGHRIRNPDAGQTLAAKLVPTPHRFILTGSPIQNNLRELWSLFDFVFPGRLSDLPTFELEINQPIQRGSFSNATSAQVR